MTRNFDPQTIAFYDAEAAAYAAQTNSSGTARLVFTARLKPGAKILELGTGAGRDAEHLLQAGFDVDASDASAGLAQIASQRIGRPVRVMRFDELNAKETYDGVWAHACLLHVPAESLSDILGRIRCALKSGGLFFSNFKAGDGAGRDSLGRYYNFPDRPALETAFGRAGPWSELAISQRDGGGYDGVARTWLSCMAVK